MDVVYSNKVSTPNTDYEVEGVARNFLDFYGYRPKFDSYGRFTNTYYKGDGIVFPRQMFSINTNHDGTTIIEAFYKHTFPFNYKRRIEQLTSMAEKLSTLLLKCV